MYNHSIIKILKTPTIFFFTANVIAAHIHFKNVFKKGVNRMPKNE